VVKTSGQVFLHIGGLKFDVTAGVPRAMYEEVVCVPDPSSKAVPAAGLTASSSSSSSSSSSDSNGGKPKPQHYIPLGRVTGTLRVTPHIDSMLEKMNREKASGGMSGGLSDLYRNVYGKEPPASLGGQPQHQNLLHQQQPRQQGKAAASSFSSSSSSATARPRSASSSSSASKSKGKAAAAPPVEALDEGALASGGRKQRKNSASSAASASKSGSSKPANDATSSAKMDVDGDEGAEGAGAAAAAAPPTDDASAGGGAGKKKQLGSRKPIKR
jgi:hypothetical protein